MLLAQCYKIYGASNIAEICGKRERKMNLDNFYQFFFAQYNFYQFQCGNQHKKYEYTYKRPSGPQYHFMSTTKEDDVEMHYY